MLEAIKSAIGVVATLMSLQEPFFCYPMRVLSILPKQIAASFSSVVWLVPDDMLAHICFR